MNHATGEGIMVFKNGQDKDIDILSDEIIRNANLFLDESDLGLSAKSARNHRTLKVTDLNI